MQYGDQYQLMQLLQLHNMEYISKDDAKALISLLNDKTYTLKEAKNYLTIKERLQMYMDDPDSVMVKSSK